MNYKYRSIFQQIDLSASLSLPIPTFTVAPAANRSQASAPVLANHGPPPGARPTNREPDDAEEPISDELAPLSMPAIMEKPERDDSWKKYLTRLVE